MDASDAQLRAPSMLPTVQRSRVRERHGTLDECALDRRGVAGGRHRRRSVATRAGDLVRSGVLRAGRGCRPPSPAATAGRRTPWISPHGGPRFLGDPRTPGAEPDPTRRPPTARQEAGDLHREAPYEEGTALLTTAVLTTGPRRRPSTASTSERVGASSVANHQVCSPFVLGARRSRRPVTAPGPTATTTARAETTPPPASWTAARPRPTGAVGPTGTTGSPRRTSPPSVAPGRRSAPAARGCREREPGHAEHEHPDEQPGEGVGVSPRSSASTPARKGRVPPSAVGPGRPPGAAPLGAAGRRRSPPGAAPPPRGAPTVRGAAPPPGGRGRSVRWLQAGWVAKGWVSSTRPPSRRTSTPCPEGAQVQGRDVDPATHGWVAGLTT